MSRLFQKNAFSVKKPSFKRVSRADSAKLHSVLTEKYPGIHSKSIHSVAAFGVNSRNWKVRAEKGSYILKEADAAKLGTLTLQADWANRLKGAGFSAPEFCRDKSDRFVSQLGPSLYCLTRFETGEYFGSKWVEWGELIRRHRDLRAISRRLSKRGDVDGFPTREFFTKEEARTLERLGSGKRAPGLNAGQRKYVADLYRRLLALYLRERKGLEKGVYHIDIHPHNMIFRAGHLRLLVDFESFQNTLFEVSVGFSLYKCARELLVPGSSGGVPSRKALDRLNTAVARVLPGRSFLEYLRFGQMDVLKRLLWIVRELLDKGSSRWRFMLATQYGALKEIDSMCGVLGEET